MPGRFTRTSIKNPNNKEIPASCDHGVSPAERSVTVGHMTLLFHSHTPDAFCFAPLEVALRLVQSDGCRSMSSVSVGVGGWGAECFPLAWQPAALPACRSSVECAGRWRNAVAGGCLSHSRGRCLHVGSALTLRMVVLLESAGSMWASPLVSQSGLSVTVSPSLFSTLPGFVKANKQVGCHGDTRALLPLSSVHHK